MRNKLLASVILITLVVSMAAAACTSPASQPAPTQAPPTAAPAAQPTATPAASGGAAAPAALRVCVAVQAIDEAWTTALLQSLDRVKAAKPHGLAISYQVQENVVYTDAERVLRQIAETNTCDVIWAHSDYYESVNQLRTEFPEILWAVAGAGNKGMGGNAYWMDQSAHEAAYLIGYLAGALTKSNVIGAVGEFPYPSVNVMMNGYAEGARAANPKVKVVGSYIQAWFDPPKAAEAATAQITAGADMMFSMPIGPIEACQKANVMCFGHYVDQNSLGPKVVLSSSLVKWDPHLMVLVEAWWEHKVNGKAYAAPMTVLMFGMAQGGVDIAPFHDLEASVPQEVKDRLAGIRQQIMDGKLTVAPNTAEFSK